MKTILYLILIGSCMELSYINQNKQPPIPKKQRKECLKQLEQDVKQYWHYNPVTGLYKADTIMRIKLEDREHYPYKCILGMDTTYVFKLFGQQNKHFYIDHAEWLKDSGRAVLYYSTIKNNENDVKNGGIYREDLYIVFKKFKVTNMYYSVGIVNIIND